MSSIRTEAPPTLITGLWQRKLPHYPDTPARSWYLAVVVITSIALYYQLFVTGAVANELIGYFDLSFAYFVWIFIIGAAFGAVASVLAGALDRWGRANIVAYGVVICSLLTLFAAPATTTKGQFLLVYILVSIVEGAVLVATPALIRDFSPQLGRASAMGFWTLGPVIGALVTTAISTHTLDSHPDWQYHYRVCGIISIVVAVIAVIGLRELSPQLRDQIMVSVRDKALIEARALGLNVNELEKGQWRQMLRPNILGSALGISMFLAFYYTIASFLVVYMATNFGYSPAKANGLGNWFWSANAIALVLAGIVSDKIKVRKPFMIVGALISSVGMFWFNSFTDKPDTGYYTFVAAFVVIALGTGIAYSTWMASFTETVEAQNPAATAVGLAVWGGTLRGVITVVLLGLLVVVNAAGTLVNYGPRLGEIQHAYGAQLATIQTVGTDTLAALQKDPQDQAAQVTAMTKLTGATAGEVQQTFVLSTQYKEQLATVKAIDKATFATLSANPADANAGLAAVGQVSKNLGIPIDQAIARLQALQQIPVADLTVLTTVGPKLEDAAARLQALGAIPADDQAFLAAHGKEVQQAAQDSPEQWKRWWWICLLAQIAFLPFVFLMAGHWSPKKAAQEAKEHDEMVARELAEMASETDTAKAQTGEVEPV
ncbi:MFS transporter [Nocardia sp. NBC_00565]|uniref:MFS transporter n=1 Tax=Nocardia sp. NBC_00565 TaxID=2975993 RepID=UPI002E80413C|nr:MFS transporter [Nocardia sp. NBC_00565]WUC06620.1 MFS transporter [Nocardia sp. NBC_00565]